MFIEFKNIIKEIIVKPEFKNKILEMVSKSAADELSVLEADLTQVDFAKVDFSIEACPKSIDADLACNVCFILCKSLKTNLKYELKPVELYEVILGFYSAESFELSLGGGGYINAKQTKPFFKTLLNKLLQQHSVGENIIETLFPIQKLKASKFEDIQKLLAIYQQCCDNNPTQVGELRLMLLAALANVELDVNNYLNQVAGSENIPWYIKRFLKDSEKLQREIADSFVIQDDEFDAGEILTPIWILPAIDVICRYRYVEFIAQKTKRPEILVALLIEAVHAFYKFYNNPNCRALKAGTCYYGELYRIIEVLRKIITNHIQI
jgi:hypothetical protein